MNIYQNDNSVLMNRSNYILGNDEENVSAYLLIRDKFSLPVSQCLLNRDLFKRFLVLQRRKSFGTVEFSDDGYEAFLYNKGIVYYMIYSPNYKSFDTVQIIEGIYKKEKEKDMSFYPKAIIEMTCKDNDYNAKIYETLSTKEIKYKDGEKDYSYSWNGYKKTIMFKRNDEYFCESSCEYSPYIDNKVKLYTKRINQRLNK